MSDYKIGKIVRGNITGIEDYGIFVNLDNFYSGLIHISEMSNEFVKNPKDYGMIGETIYVKIIDIDEETSHMKLSIKDIDYRITKPNKKSKIKEVGSGFMPIYRSMGAWIDEKLEEMKR